MIPLRDTIPSRQAPVVTWALIFVTVLVFLFELTLGPEELEALIHLFGIVPARSSHPEWAMAVGFPIDSYWPFVTSMFLHGGWMHVIGNMWSASLQIARAVRHRKSKVTVFVPYYAMSGGTLIALAADEIVMAPHGVLGPVDPQLGENPAASLLKVVAKKPIAEVDDQTLIHADIAEKAINQLRESAAELLTRSMPASSAKDLAARLSTGTWTHDYPITVEEAQPLGLNARSDIDADVLQLMTLYPQPIRRQLTVEYLPGQRHAPPKREGS